MCGITGVLALNKNGEKYLEKIEDATKAIHLRGPDGQGIYKHNSVALGHTRLSVIDTSNAASQPFTDNSGRYTIVFNGEFYNYKEHREKLIEQGIILKSTSDTEVLLYMYIAEGESFVRKINGCFALAIYDKQEETLFLTRDRMGINPLLIYKTEDVIIFASEMKALIAYGIPKNIDYTSLYSYLQLNYVPGPSSIFTDIKKFEPGEFVTIKNADFKTEKYYQIHKKQDCKLNYKQAQKKLEEVLEEAVKKRLVADVPLGAFLSGGIDSSVIVALASKHVKNLNTFSIGFKDEPFFDETKYANLVAKKYKTNHTVFSLSNDELFGNLHKVLDYIDEPFADSSALAVHILSMHTKQKVTVALSGDGADEMFAGYNKHLAHYKAISSGMLGALIKTGKPIWNVLPQSRNSKIGNINRQLNRFATGLKLSDKERYWRWCAIASEADALDLLKQKPNIEEYKKRKDNIIGSLGENASITNLLRVDMNLVLRNDMLTKVDLMSMANSLEVRTPFLDHNVVDFAFSLPDEYKINKTMKKRILQDAFRNYLPAEIYQRPKHGFEVPLLKWFKTDLKSMINDDLLNDDFIIEQGVFSLKKIKFLKQKLYSKSPEDVVAQIWALIVFQTWWKKYY